MESVPRLPTFPARLVLGDPRRRPYFVFWTGEYDGELEYCLKMAPSQNGEAVLVPLEDAPVGTSNGRAGITRHWTAVATSPAPATSSAAPRCPDDGDAPHALSKGVRQPPCDRSLTKSYA